MRSDMKKLLCERPRNGGGNARKGRDYKHYDDMPFKQTMSRRGQYGYNSKELNEYLAPLQRWVRKQVGRNWDTVFSEICSNIMGSNPVETHILQHLDGFICINTQRCSTDESKTGLVYHQAFGSQWYDSRCHVREGELYVDPDTKIIRIAKNLVKAKKKPKSENRARKLDGKSAALKINGVWYSVDLVKVEKRDRFVWNHDVPLADRITSNKNYSHGYNKTEYIIDGKMYSFIPSYLSLESYFDSPWACARFFGDRFVGINKKQMTSKELRSHNLKND